MIEKIKNITKYDVLGYINDRNDLYEIVGAATLIFPRILSGLSSCSGLYPGKYGIGLGCNDHLVEHEQLFVVRLTSKGIDLYAEVCVATMSAGVEHLHAYSCIMNVFQHIHPLGGQWMTGSLYPLDMVDFICCGKRR
ncbi:MAG: hypothetical protein AB7T74_04275 [Clostridia bacterium]|jgi:hypothetical protein